MSQIHVGIGDFAICDRPGDVIKTFALGSCVAIAIHDRVKKLSALMHVALPDSSINPDKAKEKPAYFVDTGLPLLLDLLKEKGVARHSISIKLVGGSAIMDETRRFDIGKRNVLAIKKLLWRKRLGTIAEDTGGNISRTVTISVDTGEVLISSGSDKWCL